MMDWWGLLKAEVTKPPAIMMGRIGRPDITSGVMSQHDNYTYLFGDNEKRRGRGGQAREMRGHPRSVGIRTKAYPGREPEHFWTDDNYEENVKMIEEDIAKALKTGKRIVIPSSGLGTGLSRTAQTAPRTFEYLKSRLVELVGGYQGLMEHPIAAEERRRAGGKGIRLAIIGSRNMGKEGHSSTYPKFRNQVDKWIKKHGTPEIVISGGAPGADTMAEKWAAENGIPFRIHPADWSTHGRSAGPKRNNHIVNDSTHAIAFLEPGSSGTISALRMYDDTRQWSFPKEEWSKAKSSENPEEALAALRKRGKDLSTGKPVTIIGIHPEKAEHPTQVVQDEKRGNFNMLSSLPKPITEGVGLVDPTTPFESDEGLG